MVKPIKLKLGLTLFFCLAAACQAAPPACPPGSITYLPRSDASQAAIVPENPQPADQLLEIDGQEMLVNHVVRGRLCSGSWSGTVYVLCQIEIYAWEENPNFLENCDLSIAPGTVVYVAAHQDQPYYQGCSCHSEPLDQ